MSEITYFILRSGKSAIYDALGGASYTATNNSEKDPLFVNPQASDFNLKPISPAIDAAITQGAPSIDFDNNHRPQGPACDIGAREHIK